MEEWQAQTLVFTNNIHQSARKFWKIINIQSFIVSSAIMMNESYK